ncbi:MAG: CotH kinase family protein [Deltaproteobacteria bacterium]|nr:CotH kinase family protein [Deltaproteobacteria bacterium]
MAASIPATINPSKLDNYFQDLGHVGVDIRRLPPDSEAHRLAGDANRYQDSYLWSKDEFNRLGGALAARAGVAPDADSVALKTAEGALTPAGEVVRDLTQAKVGREDVFGPRNDGQVLVARLDGLDWGQLWSEGGAASGPNLGFELFKADPRAYAMWPGDQGVLLALSGIGTDGKPRIEVKRRGNLSRYDGEKEQVSLNFRGKDAKTIGDLKLLNCQREPSQGIRVELVNEWLKALDLPYRLTAPMQLVVNGEYRGPYLALEDIDDVYFDRNLPVHEKGHERLTLEGNQRGNATDERATLHSTRELDRKVAGWRVYAPTNDTSDSVYRYLEDFIGTLNGKNLSRTDEARFNTDEYLKSMEDVMDVWGFLRTAALILAVGSWDTMYKTDGNFELSFDVDKDTGKYKASVFITDWDSCLGTSWFSGDRKDWNDKDIHFGDADGRIALVRNLLKNDKARAYYTDCLHYIVNDLARPDKVDRRMQELWNGATGASVYRDGPGGRNTTYPFDRETVRRHVQEQASVYGWGARGDSGFYSMSPARFMGGQRDNVNRQIADRHYSVGQSGADFRHHQFAPNFAASA